MGFYIWYSEDGDWVGPQPAQAPPRCTNCNSPPINGQCTNHYCSTMVRCSAALMWKIKRLVLGVGRSDITLDLQGFHWLTRQPFTFKIAMLVWKCFYGAVPAFLEKLCASVEISYCTVTVCIHWMYSVASASDRRRFVSGGDYEDLDQFLDQVSDD